MVMTPPTNNPGQPGSHCISQSSYRQARPQTNQSQHGQILTPSSAAISTAAAVAAISGSIQQAQKSTVTSKVTTGQSNLSPVATSTAMSLSSGSKPILSLPTPSSTSSGNHSQGVRYQTVHGMNNGSTTTKPSLPVRHMQQNSANVTGLAHTLAQSSSQVQASTYPSFALPQHIDYSTNSFHYTYRPPQDATPQIFQNTPLRRGKWTTEEEKYANSIIEAFEKGTIQGCENGCTLRAYLSRKLHCQPMRISKKFAGKSIGKQVFMSRLNSSSMRANGTGGISPAKIRTSNETLKQLEFHFHMSVLQEGISTDPSRAINAINNANRPNNGAHFGTNALFQKPASPNTAMAALLKTWNQQQTTTNNQIGTVNMTQTHLQENPASKLSVPTSAITFPTPSIASTKNNITNTAMLNSNNNLPQGNVPMPASQMHQNLFNAFKQAQTSHTLNDKKVETNTSNSSSPKENSTGSLDANVSNLKQKKDAVDAKEKNNAVTFSEDTVSGNAQQNWMNETTAIIPTLDPTNYSGRFSPTYTSKSFDDLHQFIGHHLPHSPGKNGTAGKGIDGPATAAANKLSLIKQEETTYPTFMNASDEYAFHAQISALEASKHSAYSNVPLPPATKDQTNVLKDSGAQSIPVLDEKGQSYMNNSNVASFNNENLERHSKENSFEKYTVPTVFEKQVSNIVSGSERSSDFGTDGSISLAGTSSSRTGSDNDSASDEGRRFVRPIHSGKRKSNEIDPQQYSNTCTNSNKILKIEDSI